MGLALRRQVGIHPEWAVAKQEFIENEQRQGSDRLVVRGRGASEGAG